MRPRVIWSLALGLSLAAVALVRLRARSAQRESRPLEARLGYRALDRHRPYRGPTPAALPSRAQLAELERTGDLHGVAAQALAGGEWSRANAFLDRAAAASHQISAEIETGIEIDRAVLAFEQGRLEDALERLDPIVTATPGNGAAQWDRSLVLAALGLPLAAAEGFDAVAALGEPGWADEARTRAGALRDAQAEHQRGLDIAMAAGRKLMLQGILPAADVTQANPVYMRYFFNHAVRVATSRADALRLLPLAETLDAPTGAHVLADYVRHVGDADFQRRAPLARRYAALLDKPAPPAPIADGFLDELRRAGELDLLVAATVLTERMRAHLPELQRTTHELGDPWYEVLAAGEHAQAAIAAGELSTGETRLVDAVQRCLAAHVEYRCVLLEVDLVKLLHQLERTAEAGRVAREALALSRRHAVRSERTILFLLADVARFRNAFWLMRAYLREFELRDPANCVGRRYVHELLATERSFALDADGARRELGTAPRCDQPITLARADLLADLERLGAPLPEAQTLVADLTAAEPKRTPGQRAQSEVVAGRYLAVHDAALGQAQLQRGLGAAEQVDDTDGQKARALAVLSLAMEASRRGDHQESLALLARGVDAQPRCALGVAVDTERALAVAADADGSVVGHFVACRSSPALDAATLVPADLIAHLRNCAHVAVFAPPPVHALPRLLPPGVAWSYRLGKTAAPTVTAPVRLVVSGVEPPARLGLPHLQPWTPQGSDGQRWLTGAAATPERVLEALRTASEALFHVHGLVDLGVSDASLLVLSPGADGAYALTAGQIRRTPLQGRPVVVLGACQAAHTAPHLHEPWGLPFAFIRAGARAVFASPAPLPDDAAPAFFDALLSRIRAGQPPAEALRDQRLQRRQESPWIDELLLFESTSHAEAGCSRRSS